MISAVILTWNSARYIERCLRTLTADAHRAGITLEIFAVDGGSTDGTTEILSQLAKEMPEKVCGKCGRHCFLRGSQVLSSKSSKILVKRGYIRLGNGGIGGFGFAAGK